MIFLIFEIKIRYLCPDYSALPVFSPKKANTYGHLAGDWCIIDSNLISPIF